jgi:signal transduction histidine kinase
LRTLATHLQRVWEDERAQFAREIYDVRGQELRGLKMDAAWIARSLKQGGSGEAPIHERLSAMQAQIDSAIGTIRRIATELRPAVLDDLGLLSALEWQAREFERRPAVKVTFTASGEEVAVNRPYATAVFRICQELLTNIARHAQTSTVEVSLAATVGALVLEVRDDGRGISQAERAGVNSLGLLGIRERAAALGGAFVIKGERGKGTVARVVLPAPTGGGS